MSVAHPPAAHMQLFFRCENLADTDTFSKSDPYCVVDAFMPQGHSQGAWVEAGRTECIMNDLNPKFQKSVAVNFFFERKQLFRVRLYDYDGHKNDEKNDKLGYTEFTLGKVVASRNHTAEFKLQPRGKLFITATEEATGGSDVVELAFGGQGLKKMDFFGKSDPYFKLFRILPNGTKTLLHKSKHIDCTLDPKWVMLPRLRINQLTTGDDMDSNTLHFECYDKDMFSDDAMGSFKCSFNDLLQGGLAAASGDGSSCGRKTFKLLDKKNKSYGEIYVSCCRVIHIPTFAEYLRGGYEINLAVAIDFTGSNGHPTNPHSLHYMGLPGGPPFLNQYVKAMMSVGDILMEYDNDKQAPVFGFGALLPSTRVTSHFFHVNMQPNPYVHGVQGILDAYGSALPNVRLSGPTNFSETIRNVTKGARHSAANNVYTILLILTDGEITDMDRTIDAIVAAGDAPLSIVIVGVGSDCDFEMMNVLDGDDDALRSTSGVVCRRDLVQFVPFRSFEKAPPEALAAEVLAEIPRQFVDWAKIVNLDPPAPAPVPTQPVIPTMGGGYVDPNAPSLPPPPPYKERDSGNSGFQMQRGSSWIDC